MNVFGQCKSVWSMSISMVVFSMSWCHLQGRTNRKIPCENFIRNLIYMAIIGFSVLSRLSCVSLSSSSYTIAFGFLVHSHYKPSCSKYSRSPATLGTRKLNRE